MRIPIALAILLVLCCAAPSFAGTASAAPAPKAAPAAPAPHAGALLSVDPLYQPVPVSGTVRTIVSCRCQTSTCPPNGQGGEICGGDPEIFCTTCRCVVAVDGSHICAQTH